MSTNIGLFLWLFNLLSKFIDLRNPLIKCLIYFFWTFLDHFFFGWNWILNELLRLNWAGSSKTLRLLWWFRRLGREKGSNVLLRSDGVGQFLWLQWSLRHWGHRRSNRWRFHASGIHHIWHRHFRGLLHTILGAKSQNVLHTLVFLLDWGLLNHECPDSFILFLLVIVHLSVFVEDRILHWVELWLDVWTLHIVLLHHNWRMLRLMNHMLLRQGLRMLRLHIVLHHALRMTRMWSLVNHGLLMLGLRIERRVLGTALWWPCHLILPSDLSHICGTIHASTIWMHHRLIRSRSLKHLIICIRFTFWMIRVIFYRPYVWSSCHLAETYFLKIRKWGSAVHEERRIAWTCGTNMALAAPIIDLTTSATTAKLLEATLLWTPRLLEIQGLLRVVHL